MGSVQELGETTFEEVEEGAPDTSPPPPVHDKAGKLPSREAMAYVCAIILLSGFLAAYAGFLLASNPEEAFSGLHWGTWMSTARQIDTGDLRMESLILWIFIGVLFLSGAAFWHKRRTIPETTSIPVMATYYPTAALFLTALTSILVLPAALHVLISCVPVMRVYWFSLPFAYFISAFAARPGRPWHRAMAVGAFALWLSMGPALDLPAVSYAKIAYNISGWMALAFIVPYGLWTSHFPAPEKSEDPRSISYSMAAVAIAGLILMVPLIAVPIATPDPQLKEHHAVLPSDRPLPWGGTDQNYLSWVYANRTTVNITLVIINYRGSEARGVVISFYGWNESINRTQVGRIGPLSIAGYAVLNRTFMVRYFRYYEIEIKYDNRTIGGAFYDFEPSPYQDECAIVMLLPVALVVPMLKRRLKGGRRCR